MKNLRYISVYSIIDKLYRDLGVDSLEEAEIIEWTGEVMDKIEVVEFSVLSTAFIEVRNYKCEVPKGFKQVFQVVRRNAGKPENIKEICGCLGLNTPVQEIEEQDENKPFERLNPCGEPILLDCNGTPLEQYEFAYYRPFFDYVYWYFDLPKYRKEWTLVKLAQHSFFNTVINNPEVEDLYKNQNLDEYNIVNDMMHFSFKDGYIAMSYYKNIFDKDGYPLIPDDPDIKDAIAHYCTYKLMKRRWYQGRDGYQDKWQSAENDYNWSIKKANVKAKTLNAEQLNQLTNYMTTLLPRDTYWNSLYKHYGLPEDVTYVKNTAYHGRENRRY